MVAIAIRLTPVIQAGAGLECVFAPDVAGTAGLDYDTIDGFKVTLSIRAALE